jgi:hypothetical protein
MPSETVEHFLDILTGSAIATPHGVRIPSYTVYVNPLEQIIEMANLGGDTKLCRLFLPLSQEARRIGEAVVAVKDGNGQGDTVIIFPCGIEMTIAMRPHSQAARHHNTNTSGEDSASKWLFGDRWEAFRHMLIKADGKGIPLSMCPFFSFVPREHVSFARTKRIRILSTRFLARELPILSVETFNEQNFCLTNETQRTVSDLFGLRRETKAEVLRALHVAFVGLRSELRATNLARARKKMALPPEADLFETLEGLIQGSGNGRIARQKTGHTSNSRGCT